MRDRISKMLCIMTLMWTNCISFILSVLNLGLDIILRVWYCLVNHYAAFSINHIYFHIGNFLSREYLTNSSVGGIAASVFGINSQPVIGPSFFSNCAPAIYQNELYQMWSSFEPRERYYNRGDGTDGLETL
jgi:hypothetical protein